MGVSTKSPNLSGALVGAVAGRDTIETAELDVEAGEEVVVAPAVGKALSLSHSPLVEGNLTLTSPAGRVYEEGLDYIPTTSGFENVRIREGESLSASYFYHVAEALSGEELQEGGERASASAPRYATLLKRGL